MKKQWTREQWEKMLNQLTDNEKKALLAFVLQLKDQNSPGKKQLLN